jgi:hypothetical protein
MSRHAPVSHCRTRTADVSGDQLPGGACVSTLLLSFAALRCGSVTNLVTARPCDRAASLSSQRSDEDRTAACSRGAVLGSQLAGPWTPLHTGNHATNGRRSCA